MKKLLASAVVISALLAAAPAFADPHPDGDQLLEVSWCTASGCFDDMILLRNFRGRQLAYHWHDGVLEDSGTYDYTGDYATWESLTVQLRGNALTFRASDELIGGVSDNCWAGAVYRPNNNLIASWSGCSDDFSYAALLAYINSF